MTIIVFDLSSFFIFFLFRLQTNMFYYLTVEASDGTLSGTGNVTVIVANLNDLPSFDDAPGSRTRSIPENSPTVR